jgi:hypothetical protein
MRHAGFLLPFLSGEVAAHRGQGISSLDDAMEKMRCRAIFNMLSEIDQTGSLHIAAQT